MSEALELRVLSGLHRDARCLVEDGAVLGGLVHNKWIQDGKPGSVTMRFGDVWAKRGGKWRVVYTEVTRIPEKN